MRIDELLKKINHDKMFLIHCDTEEKSKVLLSMLKKEKVEFGKTFEWLDWSKITTSNNHWNVWKEKTYYRISKIKGKIYVNFCSTASFEFDSQNGLCEIIEYDNLEVGAIDFLLANEELIKSISYKRICPRDIGKGKVINGIIVPCCNDCEKCWNRNINNSKLSLSEIIEENARDYDRKIVIQCETSKQAENLFKAVKNINVSLSEIIKTIPAMNTCYFIDNNKIAYSTVAWYSDNEYEIIKFDDVKIENIKNENIYSNMR